MLNNEVVLTVQDNGPGIALNEQKQVFDRFYRVLGNMESGCGLGLAIVREIAKQHKARVELGFSNVMHSLGTKVKVIFQLPDGVKD
jgi:two-component system sensor histidine kinase TctE